MELIFEGNLLEYKQLPSSEELILTINEQYGMNIISAI